MSLKDRLMVAVVPYAATWMLRLVCMTAKVRETGDVTVAPGRENREDGPIIYVPWHSRILLGAYFYRGLGINVLASRSKDGEILARSMELLGYTATRGSSSRGAVGALKTLSDVVNEGKDVIITPDGPRGPNEKVKMGAVHLAKQTGARIVPVTWRASRMKMLGSWDRLRIPLPFSKCVMIVGEPIGVPADADREALNGKLAEVQAALDHLSASEEHELNNT